jgi:hypothetical protein
LSNAPYTKAVVEQQSVVNSYAANPERVQQVSQQAPYLSLYIKVDNNFDKAILQIRDNQSGDVLRQIPTESQLEAYRRAQTSNAVRSARAQDAADKLAETVSADIPTNTYTSPASTGTSYVSSAPQQASAPSTSTTTTSTSAPAPQSAPVSIDTQA